MINNNYQKIVVRKNIIPETLDFLTKQGKKGLEGRVYWVGKEKNNKVHIKKVIIPKQIAKKTIWGVNVSVSRQANVDVTRSLKDNEFVVAKVHSHPKEAFISKTDAKNPFFRHQGAISIIVPHFGNRGMKDLLNCGVYIYDNNEWKELAKRQIKKLFSFE
ncbi:JAB domain-containing protein [Halanaerobium congolense]|jgi:predicted Fe-Mo cluster-binding NifX family protein|uniref:JAB domain-containing protein n=1 Tax=Halanaerobium congolense TaxID=54121 RepID=A0A1I0D7W7_9FIRM|nr:Mov34/MPN/PAD-1 family protein [Halanaerobium congolense]PTX14883.1 JAB domain-containing protein similar to deubiquitination enzymes [Halanaerobium congolense]SDG24455.1 JAB domain-containing protein [Halanaerobium congolense]SET28290.1 JAB domain-containing protein [Halanaerobium congolense]SFP81159.1 JAB domain-containing protein [Halanaerobium congolense]